ncbi:MAG: (Fe-S)-binding protein [Lentisphaerae bacterium]|nr:(Fe-S)-binding protein [Lentisphaerota bacterium]
MYIDQFKDVMSNCRFCFMCRHLCPTGIVSGRESDTARGRALIADTIRMHPEAINEADFVDAIYRSDLSGASRCHCDGYHDGKGYDEIGLQLALRRDIVAAGNAPEAVKAIAAELENSAAWEVSKKADLLFFADPSAASRPAVGTAVAKVLGAAGIDFGVISGGCIGKALNVLGFVEAGTAVMKKFADFVNSTGAKTLLVDTPAAMDALRNDFPAAGIELKCEVKCTASYFAALAADGKIKFANVPALQFIPGDYIKNYMKCGCSDRLLKALGAAVAPFGTNTEESYCCGEGALVLDKLNPSLVALMVETVKRHAVAGVKIAVTSAYTANILCAAGLDAATLTEIAGDSVC